MTETTGLLLSPTDRAFLQRALASAATSGPGAATRPGQLRAKLEATLSPDQAVRLRAAVHQIVVAAEENLPSRMMSLAPLTGHALHRVSEDLASARGWSLDIARQTAELWQSALGLSIADANASLADRTVLPPVAPSPFSDGVSADRRSEPAKPEVKQIDQAFSPAAMASAPVAQVSEPPAMTVLPQRSDDDEPQSGRPDDVQPQLPRPVDAEPADERTVDVQPQLPSGSDVPQPAAEPVWPKPRRSVSGLIRPAEPSPVLGLARGYAGIPLLLYFVGIVLALLAGIAYAVIAQNVANSSSSTVYVSGAPLVLVVLGLGVLVRPGLLVATADGLVYTRFDARMQNPKPDTRVQAPWSAVQVQRGFITRVTVDGKVVQIGPLSRRFAAAVQSASAQGSARISA